VLQRTIAICWRWTYLLQTGEWRHMWQGVGTCVCVCACGAWKQRASNAAHIVYMSYYIERPPKKNGIQSPPQRFALNKGRGAFEQVETRNCSCMNRQENACWGNAYLSYMLLRGKSYNGHQNEEGQSNSMKGKKKQACEVKVQWQNVAWHGHGVAEGMPTNAGDGGVQTKRTVATARRTAAQHPRVKSKPPAAARPARACCVWGVRHGRKPTEQQVSR